MLLDKDKCKGEERMKRAVNRFDRKISSDINLFEMGGVLPNLLSKS